MTFSSRTNWHRQPNRLTQLLKERRRMGQPILDLTISNPTECGISYPETEVLAALVDSDVLHYHPDPVGLLSARQAVAGYYAEKGITVDPSHIVLTASTSEAYSFVFKLLCNPGDSVLVPAPSYPLFEFLDQLNDVSSIPYHLRYDGEWHLDIESVKEALAGGTRAIIVVSPHNPTGAFLKRTEYDRLREIAAERSVALVVDEVFSEYRFGESDRSVTSTAGEAKVLTFTLNGISKLAGLPQLKLGWMVVSGPSDECREALARLELICDTFLSVNTPVQVALPALLRAGDKIRDQIQKRLERNRSHLSSLLGDSPISFLTSEGGWYAVLRVPRTRTDEEWAIQLLDSTGVYVHPGYFFDFPEDGYLVLSLLTAPETFAQGVGEIIRFARSG